MPNTVIEYRGVQIQIDDLERPYFTAAAEGTLLVQECAQCAIVRYPPSARCFACGSSQWKWRPSSGRGRVSACLIVERGVRAEFETPYAVGLVELDDVDVANHPEHAVRILSCILAQDGGRLSEPVPDGSPVEVEFEPLAEGFALPMFRIA